MNKSIEQVLKKIAEALNYEEMTWAIGASAMLYHYGITDTVRDLDIFIQEDEIEKLEKILMTLGEKIPSPPSDTYGTEYFGEFVIDGVAIDVMSNMKIINYDMVFPYVFNKDAIKEYWLLEDVKVPLTTLEDWYVLYQIIPDRESKVQMIEDYLKEHGITYNERLMNLELPETVRERIDVLLNGLLSR